MISTTRLLTILAGAGMAFSFFMPWLTIMLSSIAPSLLLDLGSDAFTTETVLFMATFVLGAVAALLGGGSRLVTLIAGLAPFVLGAVGFARLNAAASDFAGIKFTLQDVTQLLERANLGIGLFLYVGCAVALVLLGLFGASARD